MRKDEGLPIGWESAPLGDLLSNIETGKSFKCDERPPMPNEVGVVKVSAVSWGEYQEQESKTCMDAGRINPLLFVQPGDFLFSRANTIDLVGACVIAKQVTLRVMLSDKILRFQFAREAMKSWVRYLLLSQQGRQQIESLASGNQESMRNIGQSRIGQIRVPLPPPAEQTRIVEKLEELMSDLDVGVAELKAAQRKLAQYRQSLLKAAVEGALTADWRVARNDKAKPVSSTFPRKRGSSASATSKPPDSHFRGSDGQSETGADLLQRILTERRTRWEARQLAKFAEQGKTPAKGWQAKYPEPAAPDTTDLPALPYGWVWACVEQLGDVQLGRQRSPDKLTGTNPAKYIRAANITEQGIDFSDVLEMDFSETEMKTFRLHAGDVLLTEASGSPEHVGRPVIWPEAVGAYCFQNTVIRFTPIGIESAYAFRTFQASQKLGMFQKLAGGVGINHLSAGKFARHVIPLPSPSEQEAVVSALESALSAVDQQEQAIQHGLKAALAQRKNILKAAFAGQLVPQDPNDEPASVLLERIRAERAAPGASGKKRGRTPRTSA